MLQHVLDSAAALHPSRIHVVVPREHNAFIDAVSGDELNWVIQDRQLGTADAVKHALVHVDDESLLLVLLGDVPLIRTDTLRKCVEATRAGVTVISAILKEPNSLGRLVRDTDGELIAIVESRDLKAAHGNIDEINSGLLCVPASLCRSALKELDNDNAQGEYYLTDLIEVARVRQDSIRVIQVDSYAEVLGVNTRRELAAAERVYQKRLVDSLMDSGVSFLDPSRIDIRGEIKAGVDCIVDINVVFEGSVSLADNVKIEPNCVLRDVAIGAGTVIHANSHIVGAVVGSDCEIGPFARIRPGSELAEETHIGNFVEVKNSKLHKGVKAGHLAYIGDSEIGEQTNVGAGAVTCNFDGSRKNRTEIGDRVFIGTNSTLVAPLTIDSDAFIAAGSTITKNVAAKELAVGRSRQRGIKGWQRPR